MRLCGRGIQCEYYKKTQKLVYQNKIKQLNNFKKKLLEARFQSKVSTAVISGCFKILLIQVNIVLGLWFIEKKNLEIICTNDVHEKVDGLTEMLFSGILLKICGSKKLQAVSQCRYISCPQHITPSAQSEGYIKTGQHSHQMSLWSCNRSGFKQDFQDSLTE